MVIGTPDDAIEYIEGLHRAVGRLRHVPHARPRLGLARARRINSYRLFAEKVIPHFQGQLAAPRASHDWATANRGELFGRSIQAMVNAISQHVDEKEKDAEAAADAQEVEA